MITKELLISKGVNFFALKGYHSTSIKDIITAAKIPKGSFYYYFESKELFGLEIINFYADRVSTLLDQCLAEDNDPVDNVKRFFEKVLDREDSSLFDSMKALNKLHHELNEANDMCAQALSLIYQNLIHRIDGQLEMHDTGISVETNTSAVAEYLFLSCMGILNQPNVQVRGQFFEIFNFLIENKSE